jgi:hypothetical protein
MVAPTAAAHGWRCSITTRRVATTVGNREHSELGATLCGGRVGRDGENGKWGWPSLRSFTKDNEGSIHVGRQYQGLRRTEPSVVASRSSVGTWCGRLLSLVRHALQQFWSRGPRPV